MSTDETRSPEPLDAATLARWREQAENARKVLTPERWENSNPARVLYLLDALRDRDAEIERLRAENERLVEQVGWEDHLLERAEKAEAALAAVTRERDALMAGDHPAVSEAKSLAAIIEHHGWCQYGGMSTESCSRSVCDCGYEGIVPERDRLRTEIERLAEERDRLCDTIDRMLKESTRAEVTRDALAEKAARAEAALASERAAHAALRERVAALAQEYDADAADEGYGGELWSQTAARIHALLADTEPTEPGAQTEGDDDRG